MNRLEPVTQSPAPRISRLVILGNYALDGQHSMRLFAEVIESLARERGLPCTLVRPEACLGRFLPDTRGWRRWVAYIDKFLLWRVVRAVERAALDCPPGQCVVHVADHANAVYVSRLQKRWPVVVTCHDLMAIRAAKEGFGGQRTGLSGKLYQSWISRSIGKAPRIVCVSQNTRRDLSALHPHHAGCPVVFSALNKSYAPPAEAELVDFRCRMNLSSPYILHVGNNSWYKNRPFLVAMYEALAELMAGSGVPLPELVLAGKTPDAHLQLALQKSPLRQKVRVMENPPFEDLRLLYGGAEVFVFPSLYEGFGWPPIEAQACGCPVVASCGGALEEVLGNSAELADCRDAAAFARSVGCLLSDAGLREVVRQKGFKNVQRFSRKAMAAAYEAVYAEAAETFGGLSGPDLQA